MARATNSLVGVNDVHLAARMPIVQRLRRDTRNGVVCMRHKRVGRADLQKLSVQSLQRNGTKIQLTVLSMRSANAWFPPLGKPKVVVVICTPESRRMLNMSASRDEIAAPVLAVRVISKY